MMFTLCSECRFWHKFPEGRPDGECRRYAPRAVAVTPAELDAEADQIGGFHRFNWWPETGADDWCGEGMPRPIKGRPC